MPSPSDLAARRRVAFLATGTFSLLALLGFVYQWPSTFFPFLGGPLWLDWLALAAGYMAYAALSFPFDLWAGYWLAHPDGGGRQIFTVYLGRLWRGAAVQACLMTGSGLALLAAGRLGNREVLFGAYAALIVVLGVARPFVAGLLGAPAPAGLGWHAWLLAGAWNLAGFAFISRLPWCGAGSLHQLVETFLGCTLWALPAMALLPRLDAGALPAALYLSWAHCGLLGRASDATVGLPEYWAAMPSPQAEKNLRTPSQIVSTRSSSS